MKLQWMIATALFASLSAQAQNTVPAPSTSFAPIITKDWVLEDLGTVCLAHTQRTIEAQTYRLEMQLDKSTQYPVEIFVREVPVQATTQSAQFVYDKNKGINYLFSPIVDAGGNVTLYQIPRGSEALVSYIKRSNAFVVNLNGAGLPPTVVDFSLRGSSATIDQLIAKCNGKKALVSGEFEKSFLDLAKLLTLDPASLRPDQVARLRSAYLAGHLAFMTKKAKEKELQVLTAKYTKQIQELNKVKGNLDRLTEKELADLETKRQGIEAKIAAIESSIVAKQSEIAAKDQELLQKNATYDAAWQILAPHKAEHDRLAQAVSAAQSSLNSNTNRLSQIDSGIRQAQNEVAALNNEADNQRRNLSSIDSELSRARRETQDAENEMRRFDPRRELQEYLRRQPGYESDRRAVEQLERQLPQMQQEVQRLDRERDQRRQALDQCRATPNANCNQEQNQLENARQRFQAAQAELQQKRFELQNRRSNVDRIERQGENEVRREEARLRANENEARRKQVSLENERIRIESRIRDIVQFEIPSRQNTINSLRGERPSVEANIRNWQAELNQRRAAYQNFKNSVAYDAKKAAVDQAAAEVVRVKQELAKLEKENSTFNAELTAQKKFLDRTMKDIEAVIAKIRQAEGKSAELEAILKPYFEAKAVLEADISTQNQRLEAAKLAYNSELGA